jgi:tRNA pseudouridine38-40 synthase
LTRILKLTLEYDGTAYGGWQRQNNAPTVQQQLEEKLREMTLEPELKVTGAGRTDAGVHALGQVASCETQSQIPLYGFLRGLNTKLPGDISVLSVEDAAPDFNARFRARSKLYRYRILNRPARSAMRERFVWHVPAPALDLERMQAAAEPLRGRHDFAAFRSADCERQTTERNLARVDVTRPDDEIIVEVEGDAFLHNMVRIIAGTLVLAGRGDLDAAGVREILESRDRTLAGMTAPAHGLCLMRVFY